MKDGHTMRLLVKDKSVDDVAWLPTVRLKRRLVFEKLTHVC